MKTRPVYLLEFRVLQLQIWMSLEYGFSRFCKIIWHSIFVYYQLFSLVTWISCTEVLSRSKTCRNFPISSSSPSTKTSSTPADAYFLRNLVFAIHHDKYEQKPIVQSAEYKSSTSILAVANLVYPSRIFSSIFLPERTLPRAKDAESVSHQVWLKTCKSLIESLFVNICSQKRKFQSRPFRRDGLSSRFERMIEILFLIIVYVWREIIILGITWRWCVPSWRLQFASKMVNVFLPEI